MPAAIADQIYFIFLRRTFDCQLERTTSAGGGAEENGVDAALRALNGNGNRN
jgi:hypothetical protein